MYKRGADRKMSAIPNPQQAAWLMWSLMTDNIRVKWGSDINAI